MTTIDTTRPAGASFLSSLGRLLRPVTALFQRQRTLAELDRLDDWQLKDVGITRLDIDMMRRHW